jgi:hypothetical protein
MGGYRVPSLLQAPGRCSRGQVTASWTRRGKRPGNRPRRGQAAAVSNSVCVILAVAIMFAAFRRRKHALRYGCYAPYSWLPGCQSVSQPATTPSPRAGGVTSKFAEIRFFLLLPTDPSMAEAFIFAISPFCHHCAVGGQQHQNVIVEPSVDGRHVCPRLGTTAARWTQRAAAVVQTVQVEQRVAGTCGETDGPRGRSQPGEVCP